MLIANVWKARKQKWYLPQGMQQTNKCEYNSILKVELEFHSSIFDRGIHFSYDMTILDIKCMK